MTASVLSALAARRMEIGPFSPAELKVSPRRWQHWHLKRDEQNVAWLLMDKADSSANVLSESVLREFSEIIAALKSDMPSALVIRSAKPTSASSVSCTPNPTSSTSWSRHICWLSTWLI